MGDFLAWAQAADSELRGYGGRYVSLVFVPLVGDADRESLLGRWRRVLTDAGWLDGDGPAR
jgi:hypothetical protein